MLSKVVESIISVEFIYCACGCGLTCAKYNNSGYKRKFINGHNSRGRKRIITKETLIRMHKARYNGGYIDNNGYRTISIIVSETNEIKKEILEHRYIYEQYYKCCLLKWGIIHHKNGIRHDNRIENLQGMIRSDHAKHHGLESGYKRIDMSNRVCLLCGSKTKLLNGKYEHWFIYQNGFICRSCYYKNK